MREILEGSRVVAETVRRCKPGVISAYPITPQTHIVEDLAKFKADGKADYDYVRAESEFAAISIVQGALLAGERVYTATSSQGLLLMTEVVYNVAGMRLPMVMTCANRAVSSPINIWNDQQDVMTVRDSGWLLLFGETNQEVADLHVVAYRVAEQMKLPVMVNMDGFVLTHTYEGVEIPDEKLIQEFIGEYKPEEKIDPEDPKSFGTFATPNDYMEIRKDLHDDVVASKKVLVDALKEWGEKVGRDYSSGLVGYYGADDPEVVLITAGSVAGTIKSYIDNTDENIGVLKLRSLRPLPEKEIFELLENVKHIGVIDKSISLGTEGVIASEIRGVLNREMTSIVAGLGGRDISEEMIGEAIEEVKKGTPLAFIGLK